MPELTRDGKIALLLGWNEPMSVTSDHADWLAPDGERYEFPPAFYTDPAAAMELLTQCEWVTIDRTFADEWEVTIRPLGHVGDTQAATATTIPAAVAEAWWLAAKEVKRG